MKFRFALTLAILAVSAIALALTLQHPPAEALQGGYRGLGMIQINNPETTEAKEALNRAPEPSAKLDPSGQPASAVYQNVQVLKDVDSNELLRLMNDITAWVAPEQGCAYCHAEGEELSSDKLYTKVVARRMLEMTRHINTDWKTHVGDTGVTCYTCHRGHPVPTYVWFQDPRSAEVHGLLGNRAGKNAPAPMAGLTALPSDPMTAFLDYANEIRVVSATALPQADRSSIKQTEWTYALMIHISEALGVNCTFCHNTRSFFAWDQSTPQRVTAFYGVRMVRDLNQNYLKGLSAQFPPGRLGPLGDGPKVDCATCHQGVSKPLYGASLASDYPELGAAAAPAAKPGGTP
jgi:photosynthetic reaction center cytochrome c subunit